MVPKWEESIRKREVTPPTRADNHNRKARKSQANPNSTATRANASKRDSNAQKGCRNRGSILTFVLAVEQLFQFFL